MNQLKISSNKKYISKNLISKFLIKNFKKVIKKLLNSLHYKNEIYDIGSGEGIHYKDTKPHNKVIFLDIDKKELLHTRSNILDADLIVGDVCCLPYNSNSTDLITCLEVLEHVENYQLALQELFRVSRKYCIISVPNEPLWRFLNILRGAHWKTFGNTPKHVNHWNKNSFSKLISKYKNVTIKKIFRPIPWIIFLIEVEKS